MNPTTYEKLAAFAQTHGLTIKEAGQWKRKHRTPRKHVDWADVLLGQLTAMGLRLPVREYPFTGPTKDRRWRFDLAYPVDLIAVELQGSEWANGRHNRGAGMAKDYEKWNTAQLAGWTVLLFVGSQVKSGVAIDVLTEAVQRR